jgi:hypothetical protein
MGVDTSAQDALPRQPSTIMLAPMPQSIPFEKLRDYALISRNRIHLVTSLMYQIAENYTHHHNAQFSRALAATKLEVLLTLGQGQFAGLQAEAGLILAPSQHGARIESRFRNIVQKLHDANLLIMAHGDHVMAANLMQQLANCSHVWLQGVPALYVQLSQPLSCPHSYCRSKARFALQRLLLTRLRWHTRQHYAIMRTNG